MSDVTEAPTQDAIAESLLGEPAETTEAAPQEQTVAEEQQPVEQQAAEEQPTTEEVADDWLPTEQEKVFPDETIAKYAARYGLDEQKLADPLIRQLLVDKLNSDILIRQQMQQPEIEEEPETPAQPEPTQPAQPPMTMEQHYAALQRLVESRTDPAAAKAFHADFLRAFGVPENEIAALPPQQAMAFTTAASKHMLNLVNTFLPDILQAQLQPLLEGKFPGFQQMYGESSRAMAWDSVRNRPEFNDLPAYGTREFKEMADKVAEQFPALLDLAQELRTQGRFVGKDAEKIYISLAKLAKNQPMDPALLRQAAAAGARNSRRAAVKREAGNLGSGQSKSAGGATGASSRFQTNQDLFDEDTMSVYQREHGRL